MNGVATIKHLRWVGFLEGVSFLVLLFVAMPVKYALGEPLAVRVVGSAHGALFLAYLFLLQRAMIEREWPIKRALLGFVASVVPFGVFVFDGTLRREAEAEAARRAGVEI